MEDGDQRLSKSLLQKQRDGSSSDSWSAGGPVPVPRDVPLVSPNNYDPIWNKSDESYERHEREHQREVAARMAEKAPNESDWNIQAG